MGVWTRLPWPGSLGLALLGAGAIAAVLAPVAARESFRNATAAAGWAGVFLVPASLLLAKEKLFSFQSFYDYYFVALAGCVAGAVWPAGRRVADGRARTLWRALALLWAGLGTCLLLATAYDRNDHAAFFLGLLAALGCLIGCKLWFDLPPLGTLAANTLILLVIGLPLADLLLRPAPRRADPQSLQRYCRYSAAKKNPAAFECWWNYFMGQWNQVEKALLIKEDWARPVPVHLRPNSHATLVRCPIAINSLGFRGKELSSRTGDTYRIVALGESTTFGFTINPGERPWPELLEQMIRDRLKLARPVEVINAGVPMARLTWNVNRLPQEILPLKPDMILSYHGYNGFCLLHDALPPAEGRPPPPYRSRPIRLLADCEYRLKLTRYKRSLNWERFLQSSTFTNLQDTDLARAYRRLIQVAQTNHIRLILANYSMAVNDRSSREEIEFFRPRFPLVYSQIKANAAQSLILEQLAAQQLPFTLVDTHPKLDGDPDQFLDLIHCTQAGDRRLAETFFAAIKPLLEQESIKRSGSR